MKRLRLAWLSVDSANIKINKIKINEQVVFAGDVIFIRSDVNNNCKKKKNTNEWKKKTTTTRVCFLRARVCGCVVFFVASASG